MSSGNHFYPFSCDLAAAQEIVNDAHNSSEAPAPAIVYPYPQSHGGPSSGTGSAIRSAGVPSSRSRSVPYTSRPRSTESRGGQIQRPTSNLALYNTSFTEEWNSSTTFESEFAGSVGQLDANVAGSAGRSSSLAPTLIAKREAIELWIGAEPLAPGNATGSGMQIPIQHPYSASPAATWQPSSSTMVAPSVSSQGGTYPSQTTAPTSSVHRAYSHLAAGSQHYYRCAMQQCQLQHWNGIVCKQVRDQVEQYKEPDIQQPEHRHRDLLEEYPYIAAFIHGTLQWEPAREIHLHSLSAASVFDASGRDLTRVIPGFARIPGSLQLLVLMGGERFYRELWIQAKDRLEVHSVAIGTALQMCGLVICDEFWKQLATEKEAIETWREDFYRDLMMDSPDPRTGARFE